MKSAASPKRNPRVGVLLLNAPNLRDVQRRDLLLVIEYLRLAI